MKPIDQPVLSHQIKATVLSNHRLRGTAFLMRLQAADVAQEAQPGHFVHLHCHPDMTLPRPFSIMDTDPQTGSIDIFYQVVGEGSERMSHWQPGETTTLLGPVGRAFSLPEDPQALALLIGGGVGYAPLDFLARHLRQLGIPTLLLLGQERASPFELIPSAQPLPLPAMADVFDHAGMEQSLSLLRLESRAIASRLSSLTPKAGFFKGYVTDMAARVLDGLPESDRNSTQLYTCGPTPMMKAVSALAQRLSLQGQASLEAYMACGYGGCMGCVAPIRSPVRQDSVHDQSPPPWGYRRVCVDGPVFPLNDVMWDEML